jgi:hypothetical protein
VRTSSRWLRLTRNVETSFVVPADFEKSGLHAGEWGKVAGRGLCISSATRNSRFF